MTTILKITEDDYEDALIIANDMLRSGAVIIYPTDTVYGIGGDATAPEVVERIYRIKGITDRRPLSVMMAGSDMIEYYCETGIWEDIILRKHLPGPYTFVLGLRHPLPATSTKKLGIRIPDSVFCQRLCEKFGRPIITTSANATSKRPPASFEAIDRGIIDAADLAIDGGPTKYGAASVVIDLVERKLIREGGETISLIELPQP
ncbi:MAG: L-threonylcarbamoyladenylate synthase [Candidatus Aenigmatarchaeota archaeon]